MGVRSARAGWKLGQSDCRTVHRWHSEDEKCKEMCDIEPVECGAGRLRPVCGMHGSKHGEQVHALRLHRRSSTRTR